MSKQVFSNKQSFAALLVLLLGLMSACGNVAANNAATDTSATSNSFTSEEKTSEEKSDARTASSESEKKSADKDSDATDGATTAEASATTEASSAQSAAQTDRPYINRLLPGARRIQSEYDIPMDTTIAIAIQETGWGKGVIGKNNHFGLRCASDDCITLNGIKYETCPDAEECFNIFAESLKEMSEEKPGDLRVLYRNGYATSPNWVRRVRRIRRQVRKTLKEAGISPLGEET